MIKIATHDSGTGEKSKNFIHRLFEPFAKTQTKTIEEQFNAGCRYFDLRIDKDYDICHGLWKAEKNLFEILADLEYLACKKQTKIYYTLTVERNFKDIETFMEKLKNIIFNYPSIICICINRKRPIWTTIYSFEKIFMKPDYVSVPTFEEYKKFRFKEWKRFIPIPSILNKLYKRKYKFNEDYFVMVDFL